MEKKFINFKNLARYNTQLREVCRHKHIFNFQGNLFQFVLDIFIAEESHLLHRILRACPVHPRSEIQNHPLHREFPTLPCSWISRFKVNFLDNQFSAILIFLYVVPAKDVPCKYHVISSDVTREIEVGEYPGEDFRFWRGAEISFSLVLCKFHWRLFETEISFNRYYSSIRGLYS